MRLGTGSKLRLVRIAVGCLSFAALTGLAAPAARADTFLRGLSCVSLQAAVLDSGVPLGVTTEVLRKALLTGLRGKLPALKVDPSCPNRIFFKVFLQNLSTDKVDAFYGHVALEVRRTATFRDTAQSVEARAWDGESYVHGTTDQAKISVLNLLANHLAQLAADFTSANP
jgi:hypothetical protein